MRIGKRQNTEPQARPTEKPEAPESREDLSLDMSASSGGGKETFIPEETRFAVREAISKRINPESMARQTQAEIARNIEGMVYDISTEMNLRLSRSEQKSLAEQIVDDMIGFGPIQRFMEDPAVSDILVNAVDQIFVEKRGRLVVTPATFRSVDHVKQIAQKMARFTGRRVDESSPLLDARLPDGSRVNIVYPPIALGAPLISIRRASKDGIDFEKMMEYGSIDFRIKEFLQVASLARLNVIVSGGTGSGKTTLLNALSQYIDPNERIVTIEDAAELRFVQPHVVRMETRPVSVEGLDPIEQRELLKNSLRMRPDRIILGECRGAEAFDLLQAMNTGHDGSLSTLHANTPRDAISRLENMVLMAGYDLPLRVIRQQIISAVDLIVQVERMKDGARRVTSVSEITGMEGDIVTMQDIFTFDMETTQDNRIFGHFKWQGVKPRCIDKISRHGLANRLARIFKDAGV